MAMGGAQEWDGGHCAVAAGDTAGGQGNRDRGVALSLEPRFRRAAAGRPSKKG